MASVPAEVTGAPPWWPQGLRRPSPLAVVTQRSGAAEARFPAKGRFNPAGRHPGAPPAPRFGLRTQSHEKPLTARRRFGLRRGGATHRVCGANAPSLGAKTWKLAELLPAGEGELRQQGVRGLRQNPLEGGSALDAAASTGARWLHLRPLSMRKLSGRASRSSLCHSIILVSSWLGLRKPLEGARPLSGPIPRHARCLPSGRGWASSPEARYEGERPRRLPSCLLPGVPLVVCTKKQLWRDGSKP